MVSVDGRHAATVIGKIQSGDRRDIGKPFLAGVQKTTIPFMPAPRPAVLNHVHDLSPAGQIGIISGISQRVFWLCGRMRQDLPPEKTSEVFCLVPGHKAIRNDNVFPAVVIDIHKW